MPRKESSGLDERLRFLARVLVGERMTEVCRDFGISRKTGYKVFDRYKEHGLEAPSDRLRRPVRFANQLPAQPEARIVRRTKSLISPRSKDMAGDADPSTACFCHPRGVGLQGEGLVAT